jgi:small subunit ribosomal protein S16
MAIKLRLARYGGKKHAFYRLVAADERARRDGRFLEQLGTYDPNQRPAAVRLKADRVKHWLSVGAQPSETVGKLLKDHLNAPAT